METPPPPSTTADPPPTSDQQPPSSSSSSATSDPSPSTEPQPPPPSNRNPNPPQTPEQAPPPQPPPQQRPTPPSIPLPRPLAQPIPRVAIGVPANFQTSRPQNPSATPFSSSSSFRTSNSPSYVQPFAAMPRSSVGGPDSSAAQARQPVPGVQTIGMIGSLSTASTASQMRPSGAHGQNQLRLGLPQMRSITPSANQALNSQRFPSHVGPRGPTITSPSSLSPVPQSAQSLQQQWISAQGKQTNVSSLPSSSYISQIRPQTMQQRQQHSLPMTSHHLQVPPSQQQQQKQHQLQQHTQQQLQQNPQLIPPQHQAARAIVPTTSKPNVLTVVQPGLATSNPSDDSDEFSNDIISRKRIRELVIQVDRSENLRPEIEDDLLEIADDFIESVVTASCHLAKHRKSTTLEAKDILLHVERHWNMTLPGFSGDEIKCYKKPITNDIHKERLAMIKKSMVGTNDGVNTKAPAAGGQAATNLKLHATKTPAMGD